ncbi:ranBP-type and C3HC4-type zinc finger-containing protein 1-like [Anopheles ziemanni]|uniref:ranBP-type and C3HC4-type zinc finger-containing protein 1-like n=1 Tax=Anopheles coustani TaxID=139045 RepID=UPI0026596125|nr:ranBP-type and C3HC4-type zinc finger-containing protein 1-like [Anopheles coustani]XP_058168692.1 ranBP-type and C3HC4-type zinc finger-containing protein 1-like [Anopheles ziemanni]
MEHYQSLLNLEKVEVVANLEAFECPVCMESYDAGEGIVLRECLHTFCKPCITSVIKFSQDVQISCPYQNSEYSCESTIQHREIKGLVSHEDFEKHLAKSLRQAEFVVENTFHCQTPNCVGWWTYESNVNFYKCSICGIVNCTDCKAVHEGMECLDYQTTKQIGNLHDGSADTVLQMIREGLAIPCPTCNVAVTKTGGCDSVICSMCKLEICWATRGPRWGPNGTGDTSAGCRCGINGKKCHPSCSDCH